MIEEKEKEKKKGNDIMVYVFQHRCEVVLPNIFLTSEVEARKSCFFKEATTVAICNEDRARPNRPFIIE